MCFSVTAGHRRSDRQAARLAGGTAAGIAGAGGHEGMILLGSGQGPCLLPLRAGSHGCNNMIAWQPSCLFACLLIACTHPAVLVRARSSMPSPLRRTMTPTTTCRCGRSPFCCSSAVVCCCPLGRCCLPILLRASHSYPAAWLCPSCRPTPQPIPIPALPPAVHRRICKHAGAQLCNSRGGQAAGGSSE